MGNEAKFKLIYWSTRKQGDISEPYGQKDYTDKAALAGGYKGLSERVDVYRVEMWERMGSLTSAPVVEEWHGNEAHLKLKNARRAEDGKMDTGTDPERS